MAIDKRVFPTSSRTGADVDLGTNLVTEYNIASITNRLSNTDSYIIATGNTSTPDGLEFTSVDLEFVIHGYYFKLESFDPTDNTQIADYVKLTFNTDSITAQIGLILDSDKYESYNYLVKYQGNTTQWGGIDVIKYPANPFTLLIKRDNKWYIPDSSRIILNGYSITNLDEGTL